MKQIAKSNKSAESMPDSVARVRVAESSTIYRKITHYAIACISFLICVFNPYAIYKTDITQFDSTQTLPTLCALFGVFLAVSFIAIYLISFIPKKFAKIPAFIFSLALFIGLVYSFILVGDYGAMDHFILQKTPFDDRDALIIKAREFIAILAVGAIFIAFALKKLLRLWQIIFLTLFIVSAVNATNIVVPYFCHSERSEESKKLQNRDSSVASLPQNDNVGNFTQNDKIENFAESNANSTHSAPPICPTQNLAFFPTPNPTKISLLSCLTHFLAHTQNIFWRNSRT